MRPYSCWVRCACPTPGGDVAAVVRSEAGRMFVDRAVAAVADLRTHAFDCPRRDTHLPRTRRPPPGAWSCGSSGKGDLSLTKSQRDCHDASRLSASPGDNMLFQHRSIRASLDWSCQLLDGAERKLLRALSTFAGGWTVAQAHAVALPEADETDVHQLIGSLEEKGLIFRAGLTGSTSAG